jgi:anti-sigma B factor antagonist
MYPFPLPVRYVDGCAVAALPDEIDLINADIVGDALLALLDRGESCVVADMTGTCFCGAVGVRAVVRAHYRAQVVDAQLKVVISHPTVRKVFGITGADRLVRIYPTLNEVLARSAEDSIRPAADRTEAGQRHSVRPPGPIRLFIPPPAPSPSEEQR